MIVSGWFEKKAPFALGDLVISAINFYVKPLPTLSCFGRLDFDNIFSSVPPKEDITQISSFGLLQINIQSKDFSSQAVWETQGTYHSFLVGGT